MEQHYSTLELVKHDETARAPERDYDATAFELDASAMAPQVVPDTTPEVSYDSSYPEPYGQTEDASQERTSSHHITKTALKRYWMVVALVVAAAIATGIGVGTWRDREHSWPQNHSTNPVATQHILNDTSLAAFVLWNDDRQFVFQDRTGLLRCALFTASNGQWNTSLSLNISISPVDGSPNPKNHTPLAAVVTGNREEEFDLYYVSDSHHLSSISGAPFYTLPDTSLGIYSTAVNTRSLSVNLLPGSSGFSDANSSGNLALVYYENPTGSISLLLQRSNSSGMIQWLDISSSKSQSLPGEFRNAPFLNSVNSEWESHTLYGSVPNNTFNAPFTSGVNFTSAPSSGGSWIGGVFYTPLNTSFSINSYAVGPSQPGNFSADLSNSYNSQNLTDSVVRQSDVAIVGGTFIWINGTRPVMDDESVAPSASFPFARLASFNYDDGSASFLYHQINGTTFAEEQLDIISNKWLPPQYITVSES